MRLEEKLEQLRRLAKPTSHEAGLERQLEYLSRLEPPPAPLPAQRVPCGIEHYVEGRFEAHALGEFFLASQALPFGRPYGKYRIGDLSTTPLHPLDLFLEGARLPEAPRLLYLDTETTGLAGGTGTCAFLIGVGAVEGSRFVVHQYFLRDYPEEKAILAALAGMLEAYDGLVTFNGKTFDIPLLETRYALARMKSPFTRLVHLDLLHPARRLWKLRLESCRLTHLEEHILGIHRDGDIPGSEIPAMYFEYLRTGNAQGLQPVFFHNALDIVTLAALTVEAANVIHPARFEEGNERPAHPLDLFSLSRILERAGDSARSLTACRQALSGGLPDSLEPCALWHLAWQHKRRREYERAIEIWRELTERRTDYAVEAFEQLAIHYEHRARDPRTAMELAEAAVERIQGSPAGGNPLALGDAVDCLRRLARRIHRLEGKVRRAEAANQLDVS
ncbi:MAG: ribonuclease H-like domain-containing protein [Terriglobia bacterium]